MAIMVQVVPSRSPKQTARPVISRIQPGVTALGAGSRHAIALPG
jgi:hypothetical protein